ncbi:hypothetical protein ACLOJK_037272, partial [Asimina triloba]
GAKFWVRAAAKEKARQQQRKLGVSTREEISWTAGAPISVLHLPQMSHHGTTIVDGFQSMQIRWTKLSKSETPKSNLNSTSRPNQRGQQGGPAITNRPIQAACPGPAPQAQIRRLMSMASTSAATRSRANLSSHGQHRHPSQNPRPIQQTQAGTHHEQPPDHPSDPNLVRLHQHQGSV